MLPNGQHDFVDAFRRGPFDAPRAAHANNWALFCDELQCWRPACWWWRGGWNHCESCWRWAASLLWSSLSPEDHETQVMVDLAGESEMSSHEWLQHSHCLQCGIPQPLGFLLYSKFTCLHSLSGHKVIMRQKGIRRRH